MKIFKVLILIICFKSYSQKIIDKKFTDIIDTASHIIDSTRVSQKIPGIDIAYCLNGKIIWAEGFGLSNVENNISVKPQKTLFRIGSVSKSITSAALGKLIDSGKINVNSEIHKYVPYFPKKKYNLTIKQIAGHTAGIRHYKKNEFLSKRKYESVESGLKIFAKDTLLFPPGTKFSYSSYGYNLLSAAIEGASNEKFLRFIQNSVFDKLKMSSICADRNELIIPNRTSFYELDSEKKLLNAKYVDNSCKWASGGFISNTKDLITFGNAMLDSKFLSRKTKDKLLTPQTLNTGEKTKYGMGWVNFSDKENKCFGHYGGSVGGITMFKIYPNEELVVVVLTNLSGCTPFDSVESVTEMFLKRIKE